MEKIKKSLSNVFSLLIGVVLLILPRFNFLYMKDYIEIKHGYYSTYYTYEINPEVNTMCYSGYDLLEFGFGSFYEEEYTWAGYLIGILCIASIIVGALLVIKSLINLCNGNTLKFETSIIPAFIFSALYFIFGLIASIVTSIEFSIDDLALGRTAAFWPLIFTIILTVAYFITTKNIKPTNNDYNENNSYNNVTPNANNNVNYNVNNTNTNSNVDGFISMGFHVLLLLLTGGIWLYIWIYKTTKYLNRTPNEKQNDVTATLLLSLFVPFYTIYWIYKQSQKIDKLSSMYGQNEAISSICLILAIFLPIIAPIIMQNKINNLAQISNNTTSNVLNNINTYNDGVKTAVETNVESPFDSIAHFKKLLDDGIITQEEFDEKKKQLLGL